MLSPISEIYVYIQSYVFGLGQPHGTCSDLPTTPLPSAAGQWSCRRVATQQSWGWEGDRLGRNGKASYSTWRRSLVSVDPPAFARNPSSQNRYLFGFQLLSSPIPPCTSYKRNKLFFSPCTTQLQYERTRSRNQTDQLAVSSSAIHRACPLPVANTEHRKLARFVLMFGLSQDNISPVAEHNK